MTTTAKLAAATQGAYTSLMTTELNALASGSAVRGPTVDNGTNNDLFGEFSFVGGASTTQTGTPFLSLYLYPINGDGTTYGDGRFSAGAAGPPPANYFVGYIGTLATGAGVVTGTFFRPDGQGPLIQLPRKLWRPVLYNFLGVSLAGTLNTLSYSTTNYQFV